MPKVFQARSRPNLTHLPRSKLPAAREKKPLVPSNSPAYVRIISEKTRGQISLTRPIHRENKTMTVARIVLGTIE